MRWLPLVLLLGCGWQPRDLEPYPNPRGLGDPLWAAQPRRENPLEVVAVGDRVWVTLQGSEDEPGHHVVEVDVPTARVIRRVRVGSGPTGLALHPGGRFLVVFNRFSNYASVVDARLGRPVGRIPCDFYAVEGAFSPEGDRLWVTNRWRDSVQVWDVTVGSRLEATPAEGRDIPVAPNPRDIAVSPDGRTVAVASITGLELSLVDAAAGAERARVPLGAPANGLAFVDDLLVVGTTSASTHHAADWGPDGDGDGVPGDGTPNINFQDLQNELALVDPWDGTIVARYTSDTICCRDFRDVHPDDEARRGDLLPPQDTWIVGGALPEQLAARGGGVWVTYSGSNQLQRFDRAGTTLVPGPVVPAMGHNPHGIAWVGDTLAVAHRLSETLGLYDAETGRARATVDVGDLSGGDFPATDAEIGELFNFVTAPFSVDGDQTCQHCHREGGNVDKAFSMPLLRRLASSSRQTMAYRGAADTRPWFAEAAMDEANFLPVINEFARIENFCCSDWTMWPDGPPGDCSVRPPARCDEVGAPYSEDGSAPVRPVDPPVEVPRPTTDLTRGDFFLRQAQAVIGRQRTFGDALFREDPITGERVPIPLDFDGITRALGVFLLQEPRLLPNPYDPSRGAVARGEALFFDPAVGCSACHPPPTFAIDRGGDGLPVRMGPVVSPARGPDGENLDLVSSGFLALFPEAQMDTCEDVCDPAACADDGAACDDQRFVRFGVPSLRGLWDRAPGLLHHGAARGLREVLCTPGHPALRPGETGRNERDGIPDSHGATSHLGPDEIDDLIAFLETL